MKLFSAKNMAYISLGAVLLSVGAWVTIPFAVPFTLQTLVLFLILHTFGGKIGLFSMLLYILLGAVGVPVFSGFNNLYAMLAGPTAGYVLGFLLLCTAYFALERLLNRNRVVGYILPFLLIWGVYACGMGWYLIYFPSTQGAYACFSVCVLPYIVPDILKILLALILSPRVKKALR